ncbi:MAG: acyltransferase family protein [Clostridium sp.]|nr:acyltransferase family protein [Clostridium sp.]
MELNKNRRIDYIDIAKGIGIILMVMGHSLGTEFKLKTFIYLFHMPLFFFISGYFIKDESFNNIKKFFFKKVKGIYWPFLKYSLIFVILNNVFVYLHIYNNNGYYSIIQSIKAIIDCFLFRRVDQLLGAFWFFGVLFLAEIIFVLTGNIIVKLVKNNQDIVIGIISFIYFIIGAILSILNFSLPKRLHLIFIPIFFIYLGYLYRKCEEKIKYNVAIFIPFIIILFMLTYKNIKVEMSANSYSNILMFIVGALLGIYCTFYISKLISGKCNYMKKFTIYAGKNTIIIMALHMLCFKIINLLQVILYKKSYDLISSWPILYSNGGWWILYTIIGVLIPLIINYLLYKISNTKNCLKFKLVSR